MKRILFSIILILLSISIFAQVQIKLSSKNENKIIENTYNKLLFTSSVGVIDFSNVTTKDGIYTKLSVDSYIGNNDIGNPELPSFTKLIEVPYNNSNFKVNILSCEEEQIPLNDYGIEFPIIPCQPSLFKNEDPSKVAFSKNASIYVNKNIYSPRTVELNLLSKMRGVQIAQLTVNPFSYNISTNTLTIKKNIVAEIVFENADITTTENNKLKYYSAHFSGIYNKLWNYKPLSTKDALSRYPIKYVIVSDRMFEETLQPFIAWKKKKGFDVVVAYTDDIGTTTTAIKTYMQGLWSSVSETNIAPTYALFVGDVAQIPSNQCSGHISDMYYCEFDGSNDYIPEMYFGRFSATNTTELQTQINKTLTFEQYTMPDPSYLENVVLVAGKDDSFGSTHANGQVNYAKTNYFNEAHNATTTAYLYPTSSTQVAAIKTKISEGVSFVNYTAHCNYDGWEDPSFKNPDVPNLTNDGKYFFSIGNCCLSNKFNESSCFGETLLRAEGKGAVVHLGGSNNTLWDEDFYWTVGIASSINANLTYQQTTQAMYDHLFHENNEDPYITAGQMNYIGNMSVNASNSQKKQYYWEIYHVMGDPSLMPYVGVPTALSANYPNILPIGINSVTINTETNAYVAISKNGQLLDAKYTANNTQVVLNFETINAQCNLDVVITKQFKIPHIASIMITPNDNNNDAMLSRIISPTSSVHTSESNIEPKVTILNLGNDVLSSLTVSYSIDNQTHASIDWTGSLNRFETADITFPSISLTNGSHSFIATTSLPNGQADEYPANDQASLDFLVYSGNAKILSIVNPTEMLCNQSGITPEIVVKNMDTHAITSLTCSYQCGTHNNTTTWTGNIAAGASQNIQFETLALSSGTYEIIYSIPEVNLGSNINLATSSKSFTIKNSAEQFKMELKCDFYGEQTSWKLFDATDNVLYTGSGYSMSQEVIEEWCLGPGCYKYVIYDSGNNGLNGIFGYAKGSIKLTNLTTNQVLMNHTGNSFTNEASAEFCVAGIDCPTDIRIGINSTPLLLTGGQPSGGTYSGDGVVNNTFTPQTAGIGTHVITYTVNEQNCTFNIIVDEGTNSELQNLDATTFIYPNPSDGNIIINSANKIDNFEIINSIGQIVKSYNNDNNNNTVRLDLSNLENGIYFIKINNASLHKMIILK